MTKQVLSYQNDRELKRRFVRQIDSHAKRDAIIQGGYGDEKSKFAEFRGCAVGCSIHSLDKIDGVVRPHRSGDHGHLAKRLGMPVVLAYLEDRIFEALTLEEAKLWPGRFARALPVGKDLSLVWPAFALWSLTDPEFGVRRHAKTDRAREAIDGVAGLFKRELSGDKPTLEQWRDVRQNARSAAAYAADAAYADAAAYAAAYADAAAYAAAYAAADAAYAAAADAADAADDADDDADDDAARVRSRQKWFSAAADKLVEFLQAA